MTKQQEYKRDIRAFMQAHYTDERLAQLLAHAQDGKLAFDSCCCFIGIATADHPLRGQAAAGMILEYLTEPHYRATRQLNGWHEAEMAFLGLGILNNQRRIRILIPMIRAEMKRRANGIHPETAPVTEVETLVEAKS